MRQKLSRITALGAALLLILALAAGCGSKKTISGSVTFSGPGLALEGIVTIPADKATATEAIIALCKDNKLTYDYSAGFFAGLGGVASTQTDGWLLYLGDALSEVGSDDAKLEDGFSISFRYENYDEAFTLK